MDTKIPYITDPHLREYSHLHHAFMTRQGGKSIGPYASLNCSLSQKDNPSIVLKNREYITSLFQKSLSDLRLVNQVHGTHVITAPTKPPPHLPNADGLVTNKKGIILGILTADCAPILFFDPVHQIIGAAHAGWQGALKGIIGNTIEAMVALGAVANRIIAVVGPCIHQASYEVNQEFREGFLSHNLGNIKWFAVSPKKGHWQFDLPGYVMHRLYEAGVGTIQKINHDTFSEEKNFFSYRRTTLQGQETTGRQLSLIFLS